MAKRGSRASVGAQSKKKRKLDFEQTASDDENDSETETTKRIKGGKSKKQSVAKATSKETEIKSYNSDASLNEALSNLKEKFNELHRLRYTEPEKENDELRRLMEERKSVSDSLIERLEERIKELNGNAQALIESRKREKEVLDELAKSKEEIDRLRKNLELAAQERAALTRALEDVSESADTSSEAQKLASILDIFKSITGITVKVEDDINRGTCTIYNPATKKGAKFSFVVKGDDIQFTPVANKQLLRPEHQSVATVKRANAPAFMGKVITTFF